MKEYLDEYEIDLENDKYKKVNAWKNAIGLQKVDNLTPSSYLYEIAKKNIEDFQSKMYIALKETHETLYWLELLYKTEYLSKTEYNSINDNCLELKKLLSSITKTTKEKLITEKQNTNLKNKKE